MPDRRQNRRQNGRRIVVRDQNSKGLADQSFPDTHLETSPPSLSITLFGPMRVSVHGQPMPRVRTRTVEWLLALLALRHGRKVERSWLAGTLWPESDEGQALHNLRDALVHLRKALGPESGRIQSPTRDSLTLDLDGAEVDLIRFEAAIGADDAGSLREAVQLYSGPLLEGCYADWAQTERTLREEQCLGALERLAARAQERGERAEAIRHLRQAESMDPLRDSVVRRLMANLAEEGDPSAAIEAYRSFRLRLRDQLVTEPEAETSQLYHDIRSAARGKTVDGPRTDVKAPPPPQRSPLPHPITSLIGREEAAREVCAKVRESRLVTLISGGGVGKTRLAIEAAHTVAASLGGAVWVELAPLTEEPLVLPAIAGALGVKRETASDAESLLSRVAFHISSEPLLLVLDNCEHLLDAAAQVVQGLLSRCPGLRILATSRQRLGLSGEVAWRVPSLMVADPDILPADLTAAFEAAEASPAAQLFFERGASANSEFRMERAGDVEAVCRICRRLDGIPLAIELAAARVRTLTVRDILQRLDQRFSLLTGGPSAVLPRHQTLRSLIDWSFDLLSEAEKALLIRLSVFVGGWTIEAAEGVCAGEPVSELDILDHLTSLADKSLIAAEISAESVRFRILETVRQYGHERLQESGQEKKWRSRHLTYFMLLAEEAEGHLIGEHQHQWLDRLEAEHDNLRAALEWSSGSEGDVEGGLRLGGALFHFWHVRGYLREGRSRLAVLLAQRSDSQDVAVRAKALSTAGALSSRQGDYAAARILYEESLAIHLKRGDRSGVGRSYNSLGIVALERGDYGAAQTLLEESLSIRREMGDMSGVAAAVGNLGIVAQEQGDYSAARALHEESLAIRRMLGDRVSCATILGNLGIVAYELGDYGAARTLQEESLAIRQELCDRRGIALALGNLGIVAFDQGDIEVSRNHQAESLILRRELGDQWGTAANLKELGRVAAHSDPQLAARLWGAAERLREQIGSPLPPNESHRYEGQVASARAALGNDEAFEASWQSGRAMTTEEAVELALEGE